MHWTISSSAQVNSQAARRSSKGDRERKEKYKIRQKRVSFVCLKCLLLPVACKTQCPVDRADANIQKNAEHCNTHLLTHHVRHSVSPPDEHKWSGKSVAGQAKAKHPQQQHSSLEEPSPQRPALIIGSLTRGARAAVAAPSV